jgi:hypothetical protein
MFCEGSRSSLLASAREHYNISHPDGSKFRPKNHLKTLNAPAQQSEESAAAILPAVSDSDVVPQGKTTDVGQAPEGAAGKGGYSF